MDAKVLQAKVQKFGATLSAMVMPNIGAFIGWGVLTALFIPTGWYPSEYWNELVGPILTYLLPALIGYTAGSNIHGRRGGVIGALATMGAVVGADVTMLVGGMVMGPLAAFTLKKFDRAIEGHVKPGMEMLVDNFSLGFIGVALCMVGYAAVAPVMTTIQGILGAGVQTLIDKGLLPLVALFVQPAQVLFLNNAINHGIMIPLAVQQAAETGKSVLFLVEANGANWVGLTLAFSVFGVGMAKKSAPGAALIMFFGGIAEVCFPYCLMMPLTILGPIAGNMAALFILTAFGGGAVGAVSPGSVLAFFMMTPKDSFLVNGAAYFTSLAVTFIVTSFILKVFGQKEEQKATEHAPAAPLASVTLKKLSKVIFACDAGMGSSAMGVSILKKKLAAEGLTPEVAHVAVADIPADADVVVTNVSLATRAEGVTKGQIPILTLENFMDEKEYARIVQTLKEMSAGAARTDAAEPAAAPAVAAGAAKKPILPDTSIVLGAHFADKRAAIEACADIFIEDGYTLPSYKADMLRRDEETSVYLGEGVAMPHGLNSSKETIISSGICFIQAPEGVDFDGKAAYLLIGVAGSGEDHVELLGQIAQRLMEEGNIEKLKAAQTKDEVKEILHISL